MASSSVPLSISESDQSSSLLAALDRLERANSEVCSSKLLDLLELLLKILSKAIEFPSDFRWRRFKCDSPLFQQKIAALKEWHGVLTALNFMPIWQDDVQMHENDASADSSSDSEWANVSLMVMKDEVTQQQLLTIQKCLKSTKTTWLTKYTQTPAASVRLPTYSSSNSSQPADSSVSSSSPSFAKFMRADEDSKIGTSAAPISLPVVSNPISPITSRNDKCYSSAAAASAEILSSSACQINSQSSSSSSSSFSSSSSSSSVSSASSSSSSSSSSSLSGAAFDVAVAQLIAMGFPPDACSVALRRHGYLERAISELGKLSHDSQSLELAHKLQLEEHEQKSKQSFHDEQLAKQVAEQFAREADFHKSEREQRRKLEEQQSEEFIRSMQATHDREKKDSEVARKLLDDKLTLELVEEQFLRGETLPLEQNNLRILWDTGAVDSTFSCGVCYEEFKLSQVQVIDCNKHHVYCINCLESYINTEIGNGKLNMMCPNASICKHELSFRELSYSAKRSQLDRLNQLLTNQHLQSDTNVRWCPRAGCAIPMIGDADSRMMICPRCKRQFCFKCKTEEWHSGATCEDFQQWKIENSQADARFEDWRKANTKNCPRCNASIQKSGGCSHMTCRCGHEFVWETLKPYR